MLTARPKVAELALHLYSRSLHPELFQIHQTNIIERSGYWAKIEITNTGHIVSWRSPGATLTEAAASAQHPLPQRRRLKSYRLKGKGRDRVECRGGVIYQAAYQLETVDPNLFWTFQETLAREGEQDGLLHCFESSGRMALGALSFIHTESRCRSLKIRAFHTFPDDCAIVKSETLFQLPELPAKS